MTGKDAEMAERAKHIWGAGLVVAIVASVCALPNLGAHSLWDVDEARNAECAREMWEAGDWIVPTFNYELRTDKPVLPYWLMILSFDWLGVNEWSARFPSALAGIVTALITWWLGRAMFGSTAGLLAGLMLPGALLFNVLSHAVTPDALLILWTTAALGIAWHGVVREDSHWLGWFGLFTGLAVLTKGIVGVLLPMTAVGLFLIWERKLGLLRSRWLIWGVLVLLVVALPWYIAVGVATKGEWLRGFFGRHHFERFTSPLEGHSGGVWYHPVVLLVGFAPWSVWLVPMLWAVLANWWHKKNAARQGNLTPAAGQDMPTAAGTATVQAIETERTGIQERSALRYLICWCSTWLVFFSMAQTKLPNYVAPIYPALAILLGWWMREWGQGRLSVPRWLVRLVVFVWGIIGMGVSLGLAVAAGVVPLSVLEGRTIPDLAWLIWLGVVPVLGALAAWWAWRKDNRWRVMLSVITSGLAFVALGAALGPVLVHRAKIAHRLAEVMDKTQSDMEIRVACYGWFQPSIVFYVRRPVANLREPEHARESLEHPLESYLIVSRPWWEERLQPVLKTPHTVLASFWDFTRRREILLVVNRHVNKSGHRLTRTVNNTVGRDGARPNYREVEQQLGPGDPGPGGFAPEVTHLAHD